MKKIILATLIIGFAMSSNAQTRHIREFKDALITGISFPTGDGLRTIPTKHVKGTLEFMNKAGQFSNIRFVDSLGKKHALTAMPAANTEPKPDCNGTTQTGFISKERDIALYICRHDVVPGKLADIIISFATYTGADRYSIKNFKLGQ